jgi:hypothetical protein
MDIPSRITEEHVRYVVASKIDGMSLPSALSLLNRLTHDLRLLSSDYPRLATLLTAMGWNGESSFTPLRDVDYILIAQRLEAAFTGLWPDCDPYRGHPKARHGDNELDRIINQCLLWLWQNLETVEHDVVVAAWEHFHTITSAKDPSLASRAV